MKEKETVAEFIIDKIPKNGVIALGSGSTVNLAIDKWKENIDRERFVITASSATSLKLYDTIFNEISLDHAMKIGISVCIDGADEIYEGNESLLKGHGGALTREKILWHVSPKKFTIVDSSKIKSSRQKRIPIEIMKFSYPSVKEDIIKMGASCMLKTDQNAMPFITDNGNYIMHIELENDNLKAVHENIKSLPGVVETGIFIPPITNNNKIFVGYSDRVEVIS